MKKDVNFGMGAIILILLVSIVGITIYYNSTYQQLNLDYREAIENIKKTRDELNQTAEEIRIKNEELSKKEKVLIDIINELNLSKQRVTSLGEYYTSLKGEKETLEKGLDQTKKDRDNWKSEYTSAKVELDERTRSYELIKTQMVTINASLSRLQGMSDDIGSYVVEANNKIGDIEGKITTLDNDIDSLSRNIGRVDDSCENETLEDRLKDQVDDVNSGLNQIKEKINELENIINKIRNRIS